MDTVKYKQRWWHFCTSATRTDAKLQFWCGIDGADPAEKKVRNGVCETTRGLTDGGGWGQMLPWQLRCGPHLRKPPPP